MMHVWDVEQDMYPVLHAIPQVGLLPLQVATPFGSVAQAEQDVVPHEEVLLLLEHAPLQT